MKNDIQAENRYVTLLGLIADLSKSHAATLEECRGFHKQTAESMRAIEQRLSAIELSIDEMRRDIARLNENQLATFELLGDMAQAISDKVLEKKTRG